MFYFNKGKRKQINSSRQIDKLEIPELPKLIEEILKKYDSPERLSKHLRIVGYTTAKLLEELDKEWTQLTVDKELVQFGAVTHDIGKAICQKELYKSGKEHEVIGRNLLIENGFSAVSSRFAYTHGNWKSEDIELEDLLVALADKIWKGKRIFELEERISQIISNQIVVEYWIVYQKLDSILDKIGGLAQARLNWQNEA